MCFLFSGSLPSFTSIPVNLPLLLCEGCLNKGGTVPFLQVLNIGTFVPTFVLCTPSERKTLSFLDHRGMSSLFQLFRLRLSNAFALVTLFAKIHSRTNVPPFLPQVWQFFFFYRNIFLIGGEIPPTHMALLLAGFLNWSRPSGSGGLPVESSSPPPPCAKRSLFFDWTSPVDTLLVERTSSLEEVLPT